MKTSYSFTHLIFCHGPEILYWKPSESDHRFPFWFRLLTLLITQHVNQIRDSSSPQAVHAFSYLVFLWCHSWLNTFLQFCLLKFFHFKALFQCHWFMKNFFSHKDKLSNLLQLASSSFRARVFFSYNHLFLQQICMEYLPTNAKHCGTWDAEYDHMWSPCINWGYAICSRQQPPNLPWFDMTIPCSVTGQVETILYMLIQGLYRFYLPILSISYILLYNELAHNLLA